MPTLNQLVRKNRTQIVKKSTAPALENSPQKRCLHEGFDDNPKNQTCAAQNSCQVNQRTEVTAYIPGIGHNLQEHSVVLVRRPRQSLPGGKISPHQGST